MVTYLNDGNGDPCAGQLKAKLFEANSSKAMDLCFDENLGLALPTGSIVPKISKLKHEENLA